MGIPSQQLCMQSDWLFWRLLSFRMRRCRFSSSRSSSNLLARSLNDLRSLTSSRLPRPRRLIHTPQAAMARHHVRHSCRAVRVRRRSLEALSTRRRPRPRPLASHSPRSYSWAMRSHCRHMFPALRALASRPFRPLQLGNYKRKARWGRCCHHSLPPGLFLRRTLPAQQARARPHRSAPRPRLLLTSPPTNTISTASTSLRALPPQRLPPAQSRAQRSMRKVAVQGALRGRRAVRRVRRAV